MDLKNNNLYFQINVKTVKSTICQEYEDNIKA